MNSPDVMRMLHRLSQGDNFQPEPAPEGQRAPRAKRAPRKKREPSPDSQYSDSSSESDGYKELQDIKDHFEKEPCEYVSPAAIKATKTKKEAMKYLESKECPKIPALKKGKMEGPPAPAPETAPAKAKRVRKAKPVEPTPPAPEVVAPPPKKVKAKKPVAEALPPVAADPVVVAEKTEKKKRAPTAYAKAVGKYRKEGMSFGDAAKAAKKEIDAAKAK